MNKQQLKPVVCIMNPDDIYWIKEHSNMLKLADNLLTPYEAKKLIEQGVAFPVIRDNVVFTLNPLEEGRYIERTESTDADIIEKRINAIEVIVSFLGGKRFKAISKRKTEKGRDTQVGVKIKVETPKVDVDSNTDIECQSSLMDETEMFVSADFEGEYSIENYKIAVATAKQYGLDNDSEIQKLLKLRHPSNCNAVRRQTYRVNTCKDLKDNLKIAEDLKVGVMKAVNVGVEANVNTSSDERYSEYFEFEVEFGSVRKSQKETGENLINSGASKSVHEKSYKWLFWVMGGAIVALAVGLIIALA